MGKTYRCQCCYHNGKMIQCEVSTNLDKRLLYCPYNQSDANWTEDPENWKRETKITKPSGW